MYMCVRAEAGSRLDGYSGNEAMLRCKTWRKEGRGEQRRGVDWIFAFVESRSGIIAIVCRGEMMRERFDFVILIIEEGAL